MMGRDKRRPEPTAHAQSHVTDPDVALADGAGRQGWLQKLSDGTRFLGQVIYGMTVYGMVREVEQERGNLERLFVAIVYGDLLGVPILPPYYSLRLFPYVVPSIAAWRCSMLRERDLTDLCDQEIT